MIIKLEEMYASTIKNPHKFGTHQIIEILMVLHSTYMILRDQNMIVFYVSNYIYSD